MLSHKNFNPSDSINTWRNVSLKICHAHFGRIHKDPKSLLNVFCLPVDPLSVRHNFDSCDAVTQHLTLH